MECVVLIPGIMGSELRPHDGDQIWPPTPWKVLIGYKRLQQVMRDDRVATDIVRNVSCSKVYEPLIAQLSDIGFTETGTAKRLSIFHCDGRRDLKGTANALAAHLKALHQTGAQSVIIVARSMGGSSHA